MHTYREEGASSALLYKRVCRCQHVSSLSRLNKTILAHYSRFNKIATLGYIMAHEGMGTDHYSMSRLTMRRSHIYWILLQCCLLLVRVQLGYETIVGSFSRHLIIVRCKIQPWSRQAAAVKIIMRPRSAHCPHDQRLAPASETGARTIIKNGTTVRTTVGRRATQ